MQNWKDKKDGEEGGEVKEPEIKPFNEGDKADYQAESEGEFVKVKVKIVNKKDPEAIIYSVENEDGEMIEEVRGE